MALIVSSVVLWKRQKSRYHL